jgi:hypothetical protein
MRDVHRQCFDFITEDCSKNAHNTIKVDYSDTMNCVENSFDGGKIDWKADNKILKDNARAWLAYGVLYWPSVTINQMTYRGDITPANILETICAGLASKPQVCLDFYEEENIDLPVGSESIVTAELLVLVVILLIAVNVALIIAYRKCAKKEMEEDIGFQVSSAVSQYIALSQNKMDTTVESEL